MTLHFIKKRGFGHPCFFPAENRLLFIKLNASTKQLHRYTMINLSEQVIDMFYAFLILNVPDHSVSQTALSDLQANISAHIHLGVELA